MSEVSREELDAELDRHRDALAAEKDWRRNRVYDETYEWLNAAEDFADEVDRLVATASMPDDAPLLAEKMGELIRWFDLMDEFAVANGHPELARAEIQNDIRRVQAILRGGV